MKNPDQYIINFKNWRELDFLFILLVLSLFSIGVLMLYSAGGGSFTPWASSQLKRFVVSIPLVFLIISIDIRFFHRFAYIFYLFGLLLLVYANYAGFSAMGAKRWVDLGFFNLQPSEFMKITLIMALSKYFHNLHINKVRNILFLFFPIIITALPVYLIIRQPDLGTSIILLASALVIFFVSGVSMWKFVASGIVIIFSVPFIWTALKAYQKQRVLTFLNPENDPLGAGYNIIQSKIAIGSGGFLGKGYLSGSQGQLNFLPERETDFIFTMIAEEFGFFGSFIIIALFGFIFFRSIQIALNSRSHFGKYLAVGICFFLFFHFFINIAMVTGIIPVVGAPLPLISYGGTMLVITMIAFALILNIDIHRDSHISRVERI